MATLRHVTMVAKFLDLDKYANMQIWQKKKTKLTCLTFLCMIALRNKTVEDVFLPIVRQ